MANLGRLHSAMQLQIGKEIIDSLPFGVLVVELSDRVPFRIAFVNTEAERSLGKVCDDLVGKSFLEFIFAPDGERISAEMVSSLAQNEEFSAQVLLKAPNSAVTACILQVRNCGADRATVLLAPTKDDSRVTLQDRQVVEEVLRLSEVRYQALIENSADAIAMFGVDGSIFYMSPAAKNMLGFDRDDFVGRTIHDFIHPADRAYIHKLIADAVDNPEKRIEGCARIHHKDGHWIYKEGSFANMLHVPGVRAIVNNFRDITARRIAEEALRETEERFSKIFHANPIPTAISRLENGLILDVNQSFCNLLGYDRNDLINRRTSDIGLYPSASAAERAARLLEVSGSIRDLEMPFRTKEGELRDALRFVELLNIQSKEYVLDLVVDVTERTQTNEKLAEQAALLDKARDAIILTDLEDRVVYWNHGAERLYGWTKEEVFGRTQGELIYSSAARPNLSEARDALLMDEEWSGEHNQVSRSGSALVVECSWSLVRNTLGAPKSILVINSDITERKQLEHQFLHAQKMESLGTLAGGIAHDFNNVLGIVVGHATLLRQSCAQCDLQSRHVDNIVKAANRGASLVRQLLTFACKDLVSFESLRVNDLISDLVKLISSTFPKTVDFSTLLEPGLPPVRADTTQIHQALLNLCVNARDAMAGVGSLLLSTGLVKGTQVRRKFKDALAREYVRIVVSDTGSGIDPSVRGRIFEPFFTTKGLGKGSGLGLAVVFGVVENHEGFIDVETEVGKGSSFCIYLPAQPQTEAKVVKQVASGAVIPRGTETILVMEDEDLLRELIESVLTDFGYKVLAAPNGEVGLEIFEREQDKIDLVMADVGMPKISGWEALARIRVMKPDVKSLVMTGYVDPQDRDEMERAGARDVLLKPCDVADILRKVREVLDQA